MGLQRNLGERSCLSSAAARGHWPLRCSQHIIFCAECLQGTSRHLQTDAHKLCCKAAEEEEAQ